MTRSTESFDVPLIIAGAETAAEGGRTLPITNPATGRAIGTLAAASAGDVDRAVQAAQRAFDGGAWSQASVHHRARVLQRFADLFEADLEEFYPLETLNNGRPIRDKFIQHAVREAYRGLTEPGRHPAAILLLELPAGDVDVNVHPTKAEVRFRDSGRIHGLVMAAVRERLLGSDLSPSVVAKSDAVDEVQRADLRTKLAEFFKVAPTQGTFPTPSPASASTSHARRGRRAARSTGWSA